MSRPTRGKGTLYFVLGGAGAAQRSMVDTKQIGETSWMAARKPDPDRGEMARKATVFAGHPRLDRLLLTQHQMG